jgi:hypothetical protein
MDIFFQDPTQVPLPPNEVRVTELRATMYADGRRVKVTLALTSFQKRPNLSLEIRDALEQVLAETEIIETMTPNLDLTLHLRHPNPQPPYTLFAILFYAPPIQPDAVALPERTVVHTASCSIIL